MKAVTYDHYGDFDVLSLREINRSLVRGHEVMVKVHAAALHIGDCFCVRGSPSVVRFTSGLRRPKYGIPGFDLGGTVESVGGNVSGLKPGDEVFGVANGTCAEYVVTGADKLVPRPAGLSFEEAAALPTSGLAALHALRDAGKLKAGQRLLVNGASGGVGTFAVQIGKAMSAEVTGVCSSRNAALVRSIGADAVVDYTQADFTAGGRVYDLLLDNVENRPLAVVRQAVKRRGTVILNSGTGARGIAMVSRMLTPIAMSPFVGQSLRRYISTPNQADLMALKELVDAGKVRPVIGRTYRLEETAAALAEIEGGHVAGKVVVTV